MLSEPKTTKCLYSFNNLINFSEINVNSLEKPVKFTTDYDKLIYSICIVHRAVLLKVPQDATTKIKAVLVKPVQP